MPPAIRREPKLSFPERKPAPVNKDVGTTTIPSLGMFAAFGGYPASTGTPVTPFTALQASAVYGCVNCISQDIGKLSLTMRRKLPGNRGYTAVTDHPLLTVLRKPNPWQTRSQFWRYLSTSLKLRGNAYAAILRNYGGEPTSLIPLSPDVTTPVISDTGRVFYRFSHPMIGQGQLWYQENILHFRDMMVDGGYVGLSPIAYAQDVMGVAIAAQRHAAILFRQGNQTGGVLSTDKPLSPEGAVQIANEVANHYQGVENSSKPMVLGSGMTYERMTLTNEEAQFLESRRFSVEEICRIFRVPPHKVQHLVGGTFSDIENEEQAYINDTLQPVATEIEQMGSERLLFEDDIAAGIELYFDFDSLLRGNQKARYEAYSIGTQTGILSVNEARAREGLPPIEGGDVHRFPLNTGDIKPPSPPPTGAPGNTAPEVTPQTAPAPEDN
ncbi:phage portal protein [Komagataeibacter medellinensis]|uniref:Phage major capsid protein HK97 n=1 Tax=Komagataeibacter medellinensis (strain NBRC 3288 / BCRC 11682 / LMG 1693 / Kondo 51) TaxID=634177 RepID=G2I760_KOMMN|nr:phage portal protein [Komagataeibacter medellinensis]BAK83957.1 phage major capsid protein HK97 [Komagataeibacter medellinensis NBRC 3288]